MPIQRVLEIGSPRVIGVALAGAVADEATFLSHAAFLARYIGAKAQILVIFPDSAVTYVRTDEPVAEDEEIEHPPYFRAGREIVSPTNGKYVGSLVTAGLYIDSMGQSSADGFVRLVGVTEYDGEEPVFGLVDFVGAAIAAS